MQTVQQPTSAYHESARMLFRKVRSPSLKDNDLASDEQSTDLGILSSSCEQRQILRQQLNATAPVSLIDTDNFSESTDSHLNPLSDTMKAGAIVGEVDADQLYEQPCAASYNKRHPFSTFDYQEENKVNIIQEPIYEQKYDDSDACVIQEESRMMDIVDAPYIGVNQGNGQLLLAEKYPDQIMKIGDADTPAYDLSPAYEASENQSEGKTHEKDVQRNLFREDPSNFTGTTMKKQTAMKLKSQLKCKLAYTSPKGHIMITQTPATDSHQGSEMSSRSADNMAKAMVQEQFMKNINHERIKQMNTKKKVKKLQSKQSETALFNSNQKEEIIFTTPQDKEKSMHLGNIKGFDALSRTSKIITDKNVTLVSMRAKNLTPHLKTNMTGMDYSPPDPPLYKILSHRGTIRTKAVLSTQKSITISKQPQLNSTQKFQIHHALPKSSEAYSRDLYSSKKGSELKFYNSPLKSERSKHSGKTRSYGGSASSKNTLKKHSMILQQFYSNNAKKSEKSSAQKTPTRTFNYDAIVAYSPYKKENNKPIQTCPDVDTESRISEDEGENQEDSIFKQKKNIVVTCSTPLTKQKSAAKQRETLMQTNQLNQQKVQKPSMTTRLYGTTNVPWAEVKPDVKDISFTNRSAGLYQHKRKPSQSTLTSKFQLADPNISAQVPQTTTVRTTVVKSSAPMPASVSAILQTLPTRNTKPPVPKFSQPSQTSALSQMKPQKPSSELLNKAEEVRSSQFQNNSLVSYPSKGKRVKSKGARKNTFVLQKATNFSQLKTQSTMPVPAVTSQLTKVVGLNIRQSLTASIATNPVLNQSSSIRSSVKGPNFFTIQNRPTVPRARDFLCQTVAQTSVKQMSTIEAGKTSAIIKERTNNDLSRQPLLPMKRNDTIQTDSSNIYAVARCATGDTVKVNTCRKSSDNVKIKRSNSVLARKNSISNSTVQNTSATVLQRKSTINSHYVTNSTALISTQPKIQSISVKGAHAVKAPKAAVVLFESEKQLYGDRCPKGYQKGELLGKGGCAVVWLARDSKTGQKVALKQFPKQCKNEIDPSAQAEIKIWQKIATSAEEEERNFPGLKNIAALLNVVEDSKDLWLAYEVGGASLGSLLFNVKGEFYKGERIYNVQHQEFYQILKKSSRILKDFIRLMAEIFDLLATVNVIHADIKPDNILVAINFETQRITDLKLIDFGSAFQSDQPSHISATTPEYLAPEVLDFIENRGAAKNGNNSHNLTRSQQPWSYDIWSLGAILLEMLTGIPIWMSLKSRATTCTGKQLIGMGIFGVQGRGNKKILQRQFGILKNLQKTLMKFECYGLDKDPLFMDLLCRMLDFNPLDRISPRDILKHPYICQ